MNHHKPITQLQSFATLDNACFTHSLHLTPFPLLFWNISKIRIYHVINIYRYLTNRSVHWENRLYLGTWEEAIDPVTFEFNLVGRENVPGPGE